MGTERSRNFWTVQPSKNGKYWMIVNSFNGRAIKIGVTGKKQAQFEHAKREARRRNKMLLDISGDIDAGRIVINGRELPAAFSLTIRNHSPDGFSWGYGGSGPSQLALAILLEYLPRWMAERRYQEFKFNFVAKLPMENFTAKINLSDYIDPYEGGQ